MAKVELSISPDCEPRIKSPLSCGGQAKTDAPLSGIGPLAASLELVWTLVAQVRVQSPAVVEHRDVRDDVCLGFFAGLIATPGTPMGFAALYPSYPKTTGCRMG
jgi:hypothetical protein